METISFKPIGVITVIETRSPIGHVDWSAARIIHPDGGDPLPDRRTLDRIEWSAPARRAELDLLRPNANLLQLLGHVLPFLRSWLSRRVNDSSGESSRVPGGEA